MTEILTITASDLEHGCDIAGLRDFQVRTDYSGRGMYGDRCFGITCGGPEMALVGLAVLAALNLDDTPDRDGTREQIEGAVEIVRAARTDNMGRDMIVYFPGYQLADADAEVDA
jgi:hypothetical protein